MKKLYVIYLSLGLLSSSVQAEINNNVNDKLSEDAGLSHKLIEIQKSYNKENLVPVVIIGGGPAGYTAGLYTGRAGIYTVLFGGELPGGQLTLTSGVENWPGVRNKFGGDIMNTLEQQVKEFGTTIVNESIEKVDFKSWPYSIETSSGKKIHALSVIIATGATPKMLGIEGENYYFKEAFGVTTCAVCDCHFYKGKDVVVVGGGDSAVEEAMQLAPFAKSIKILVRKDKMRAAATVQEKLSEFENITVVYNKQPLKVLGDEDAMTGLEVKDTVTGEVSTMNVEGLFLAIGRNPNTSLFEDQLSLDRFGYIYLSDRSQATSVPGVFAAGDVEDPEYRQAVVSCGAGSKAGLDAVHWLRNNGFTDKVEKKICSKYYKHISEE